MRRALPILLLVACAPAPEAPRELARARELVAAGEHAAALEQLERWLAAEPDAPAAARAEAHREAVHACAELALPERGLAHAERALELSPDDPWTHYAHGVARQKIDGPEAALASFGRALVLDPRHLKSWQFRASILYELDRREESLEACERTLAILETADPATLASWGADAAEIERWTRGLLDALGR